MPTREQISLKIRDDLAARGMSPSDPVYQFALLAMEDMNNGTADLDDELADLASRLTWLAQAPTWLNQRPVEKFDAFVISKLTECEAALAAVRARWERHQTEKRFPPGLASER